LQTINPTPVYTDATYLPGKAVICLRPLLAERRRNRRHAHRQLFARLQTFFRCRWVTPVDQPARRLSLLTGTTSECALLDQSQMRLSLVCQYR